jgi:hypothetical protein
MTVHRALQSYPEYLTVYPKHGNCLRLVVGGGCNSETTGRWGRSVEVNSSIVAISFPRQFSNETLKNSLGRSLFEEVFVVLWKMSTFSERTDLYLSHASFLLKIWLPYKVTNK